MERDMHGPLGGKMHLVLARDKRQFDRWRRNNPDLRARYVCDGTPLVGHSAENVVIVHLPDYSARPGRDGRDYESLQAYTILGAKQVWVEEEP